MPTLLTGRNLSRALLANEEVFATTLLALFLDQYGTEALEWHPATMRMELEQDMATSMPVINGDKLSAAVDILTTDSFFRRVSVFINHCNVLNNSHPAFGGFDPADAEECAWGITEAMLLAHPEEDDPFSEEIRYYIGKVLHDEGIKTPPDVLQIGLHDEGADFSDMSIDEPAMFQAEFKVQQDESEALKTWLRNRLRAMIAELQTLELENGDTKNLLKNLKGK